MLDVVKYIYEVHEYNDPLSIFSKQFQLKIIRSCDWTFKTKRSLFVIRCLKNNFLYFIDFYCYNQPLIYKAC